MNDDVKSAFSTVKRARERGAYDRNTLYAILDATPVCHVGYTVEGRPVVTPTCHWRDGDYLYWHGSRISRALQSAIDHEVCITVTLFDGLVLARSAFHHSANYRSAMVFGRAELVDGDAAKTRALETFVETLFPERWGQLRPMSRKELNATSVLRLPIQEASAKVRTGPPKDDAEDLAQPVWAGVIPLQTVAGSPQPAPDMTVDVELPEHVTRYGAPAPDV